MASDRYVQIYCVGSQLAETFPHLDLFVTHFGVTPAGRRQVAARLFRIKFFQVKILHVGPKIRGAPGNLIVVAQHYSGSTGKGYAGNMQTRGDEFGHIPDAGCKGRQVRVVCQQRLAGGS